MQTIKIAGVPEHFNLPWHLGIEEELFKDVDVDLVFTDYPGGTGAMTQALVEKEVDMALLLTEGAVKFIAENPEYKIVNFYVESPLIWGVHAPINSKMKDSEDKTFAISRFGSGSHLMAYVYANNLKIDLDTINFELIKNLSGLREAYKNGLDALFLWEKFTTKPFVDGGEMQRIDTCPTPWPCFVLVAKEEFLKENKEDVSNLLDGLHILTANFKDRPNIENIIAKRYQLKVEDVEEWIADTKWAENNEIEEKTLHLVINTLKELGLINRKLTPSSLVSDLTELT